MSVTLKIETLVQGSQKSYFPEHLWKTASKKMCLNKCVKRW